MVTTASKNDENQPLMLAQDQQVVVKMRLARREIPSREAGGGGNQFNGAVGAVFPGNEFVVFSHFSSDTRRR